MAILADGDIRELIRQGMLIDGGPDQIDPSQIQPSSLDLTLAGPLQIPQPRLTGRGYGGVRPYLADGSTHFITFDMEQTYCNVDSDVGDAYYGWEEGQLPEWEEHLWVHGFWLNPGDFILGSTREIIKLPDHITARLNGKSTLGRWGLSIHITAGFVDAGFNGPLTLEIKNEGPFRILLEYGMRIAQIDFETQLSRSLKPYRGKYQMQSYAQPPLPSKTSDLAL